MCDNIQRWAYYDHWYDPITGQNIALEIAQVSVFPIMLTVLQYWKNTDLEQTISNFS